MVNVLSEPSRAKVRLACELFFNSLQQDDLHDHPEVFSILDDVARRQDYMICAEQKGIFGIVLKFVHEKNAE